MSVRVRFAPSPTGFLHIGGARTALFNWLFARHHQGTLILRIEDTDAARNTPEAMRVIVEGLRWLGLDWDEGPLSSDPRKVGKGDRGPYFQSQRLEVYRRRVQELQDRDMAYERDGVVRFRMTREPIVIRDEVVGEVVRELTDREAEDPDFVLVRSDGQPVFHFVNVVDDIEMAVTHVIRGEDHLSNTAKHVALFRAFGVEPPKFAHIPLILNTDGSKMSKRDQGASLAVYPEQGYVPEAVVNYLSLLGWSPKDDCEILSVSDLVDRFDLPQVLRHNARFDLTKLQWLNYEHLRSLSTERMRELGCAALKRAGFDLGSYETAYIDAALETCREKIKTFGDLAAFGGFYFRDAVDFDEAVGGEVWAPEHQPRMVQLRVVLAEAEPFSADRLQGLFKETAKTLGVKVGLLVHPVRFACTGNRVGPSLYDLMAVLGRDRVFQRIDRYLDRLPNG